ncbi:MAG: ChbG/HpnK family deacetylase [Candidatus Sulfotelmatobacter sp.]
MRRLIVNADDFGFTAGVNRAIIEAHSRGVVTSSTLMANGRAFAEAIRMARSVPNLSVGCHVVLIDGEPVLDARQIPTLSSKVAGASATSHFRNGINSFAVRALAGRLNPDQIEAESVAQIRKIQSAGILVSHVDTHKHTHLFPQVLRPLLRAARSCGVRAVRNPFGPRRPLRSQHLLTRPRLWTRYAEVHMLRRFAEGFLAAAKREGFVTPDGTLGIVVTGALNERLFRAIAESIPEGTWEFVCHPGYNDEELRSAKTRLRQSRETELRVLTMPDARELLMQEGIELISYRDLTSSSAS